jgi:hypothetical protein
MDESSTPGKQYTKEEVAEAVVKHSHDLQRALNKLASSTEPGGPQTEAGMLAMALRSAAVTLQVSQSTLLLLDIVHFSQTGSHIPTVED